MGVDYTARFGIGYEISLPLNLLGKDSEEKQEFFDEILKDSPFSYFSWGDDCYTGDETDQWAIVIKKEPDPKLLPDMLLELRALLKKNSISFKEEKYLVGGVDIW